MDRRIKLTDNKESDIIGVVMGKNEGPKVLFIDIETKPILAWVWGLFDQNIALNQIKEDWCIISWAAKWADSDEVMQHDLRKGINDKNEKKMLEEIQKLMCEADFIIGQNSKAFDVKKLNERFLKYDIAPPSPYRQIDTYVLSKKHFAPTSHKLEYRSKNLNKKFKKMDHSKFPGFTLWSACTAGNQDAWKEMALYNIFDVKATEEYYNIIKKWDNTLNFNVYTDDLTNKCNCGSPRLQKRGFGHTNTGKFQRFQCTSCGTWTQGKINLLTKEKKQSLKSYL